MHAHLIEERGGGHRPAVAAVTALGLGEGALRKAILAEHPPRTVQELAEIEQALGRCKGNCMAETRLTGTWLAHALISSKE